jgi:heme-degrading monooxygenase HmoA
MVVYLNTYKLRNGASVSDFKETVKLLIEKDFTKRQGFISFKLLAEDDGFADYSEWKTMEDYNAFLEAAQSNPSETALAFYEFLNMNSCKSRVYTVEIDM